MANRLLDEPDPEPPHADAAVDDYLAILAKDLPWPPGPRAAALDEVRDGLNEAIASHVTRGLLTPLATREALAELGSPTTVAEAFAPELATAQARRTLLAFLITGPLVGVWWLLLLPSRAWPPRPETLWIAIPALTSARSRGRSRSGHPGDHWLADQMAPRIQSPAGASWGGLSSNRRPDR